MEHESPSRGGRLGWIVTAVAVGGSFVGVVGWYLLSNRGDDRALDTSGFDIARAPDAPRPRVAPAPSSQSPQRSGLDMMRSDAGIRIVGSGGDGGAASGSSGASATPSSPAAKKAGAHSSFTENARKHERDVFRFAQRMTAKYPIIRQYGKDWMSHPDLKKLNDDYMRNHDPVAFLVGLGKAPSLGPMLKQYAGHPEIREFIVEGMKQAPGELTSSAMDVLQTDGAIKGVISNIAGSLGLPPSITGLINSADPSKTDASKITQDVLSNPELQKAMQQQGQQAPPVQLGR